MVGIVPPYVFSGRSSSRDRPFYCCGGSVVSTCKVTEAAQAQAEARRHLSTTQEIAMHSIRHDAEKMRRNLAWLKQQNPHAAHDFEIALQRLQEAEFWANKAAATNKNEPR